MKDRKSTGIIIPDFDAPDDYEATERLWYRGAVKNGGKVYVTAPYQDALTGSMCYSVSVMLGDGETVVAVDYSLDTIQSFISQMYANAGHQAVIVTDDGIGDKHRRAIQSADGLRRTEPETDSSGS